MEEQNKQLQQIIAQQKSQIEHLTAILEVQAKLNQSQAEQNRALSAKVDELLQQIDELSHKKNSRNSSDPPSSDGYAKPLAKSIGGVGYYHTHDIMDRFDDWCRNGVFTPGGKKFDIGNTCAWAIDRYRKGCTPALCGSNKMNENGNGSLMRSIWLSSCVTR